MGKNANFFLKKIYKKYILSLKCLQKGTKMFEKEFVERLQELYKAGKTYEEISSLTGISKSALGRVISGSRPPKNLTVDALLKAFPNAEINLYGDKVSIDAPRNSGNVVGVNNGSVIGGSMELAVDKILASEDLSDSEKIKVLKVLKK